MAYLCILCLLEEPQRYKMEQSFKSCAAWGRKAVGAPLHLSLLACTYLMPSRGQQSCCTQLLDSLHESGSAHGREQKHHSHWGCSSAGLSASNSPFPLQHLCVSRWEFWGSEELQSSPGFKEPNPTALLHRLGPKWCCLILGCLFWSWLCSVFRTADSLPGWGSSAALRWGDVSQGFVWWLQPTLGTGSFESEQTDNHKLAVPGNICSFRLCYSKLFDNGAM